MSTKTKGMRWLPLLLCVLLTLTFTACGRAAEKESDTMADKNGYPSGSVVEIKPAEKTDPEEKPTEKDPMADGNEQPTTPPEPGYSEPPAASEQLPGDDGKETSESMTQSGNSPATSDPEGGSTDDADPENAEQLAFALSEDGTFYTVTGLGSVKETEIVIPDTYEGLPVKAIGKNAFRAKAIESVSIPASVETVEKHAFYACTALETVTFADGSVLRVIGEGAFANSAVKRLVLPATLEVIGMAAFERANSLTHVTVPMTAGWWITRDKNVASGTVIDRSTMGDGTRVADLLRDQYHTYYWMRPAGKITYFMEGSGEGACYVVAGIGAFRESELNIPATYDGLPVTRIADGAFVGCTFLKSVTVPNTVSIIGDSAFSGCTRIESITLPALGSSSMLSRMFGDSEPYDDVGYAPESLKTVTFVANSTSTGNCQLSGQILSQCKFVEKVVLGEGISVILERAFEGCTALKEINLSGVERIGYRAFYGCTALSELTLEGCVDTVEERAFEGCTALERVFVGANVGRICVGVFEGCTALESVTFAESESGTPEGLIIENSAFKNCAAISSIVFPARTSSLGKDVLTGCNALSEITTPFVGSSQGGGDAFLSFWFGGDDSSGNGYYVPTSLKTVNVSGGRVCDYTFYECKTLESVTLSLDNGNGYIGNYAFWSCIALREVNILSGCTYVGEGAFEACTSLEEIVIPDVCYSIGKSAFGSCEALKKMTIPFVGNVREGGSSFFGYIFGSSYWGDQWEYIPAFLETVIVTDDNMIDDCAFYACLNLKTVILQSTETIGENAFNACSSLKTLVLPENLSVVKTSAFEGCAYLEGVFYSGDADGWQYVNVYNADNKNAYFVNAPRYYYSEAYPGDEGYWHYVDGVPTVWKITPAEYFTFSRNSDGTYTVTGFDQYSFTGTEVFIPAIYNGGAVTSIGGDAFRSCTSLESITIPDSVTSIGTRVFSGCTSLTAVTIPDGVTSIGWRAFFNCTSLTAITIPDGVTSIGEYAFSACISLTSITIPDGVTSIGEWAFEGCTSLTAVTIGDGVTSIGDLAFRDCDSLTSITIPDSVVSIGEGAFQNCDSLTSITIPDSVTSIGAWTFSGCVSLASITIPDSVTSVGEEAFSDCSSLTTVYYGGSEAQWQNVAGREYVEDWADEIVYNFTGA